jgi:type I restriction enzyme S subunit
MKNNWEVKKLGEVSKINYGYTEKASFTEVGPKFLRITDIQDNGVDWETVPYCKIDKLDLPKYLLKQGDIVFARTGATTGKSYLIKNPPSAVFASYLIKLQISDLEKLSPDFLILFFQTKTYWDKIQTGLSGSAQGGFNASKLADLSIPIPPLPEQQRIVAILDEAFAAIAQAKENAEKNLQNAREFFDSYLQSVFAIPGNGWEEKNLGEIGIVQSGGTPLRSTKEYWEGGNIAWYSSGELNNLYTEEPERFITQKGLDYSNAKLFPKGSLLIGMYDTAALKMSILDRDAAFNQAIAGVKPNDKLNLVFVLHAINAIKPELLNQRRGVRQKNLSLEKIKNISLLIPKLTEQNLMVSKLDTLSTETKKLENIYRQKINDLGELKKSILQKAFSGELTAKRQVSNVIDFPVRIPNISATDLQAGIVALAFQRHQQKGNVLTFGHVKAEKIVHLAQSILNVELDREPVKDAAGPNDFPRLKKVEWRAENAGFFRTVKQGYGYTYIPGNQFDNLIEKTKTALNDKAGELTKLIDLLVPMDTQQAELVATVYAAWNNLLIDSQTINDEAIITEARENWHEAKLNIPRERFFNTIDWMKQNNLIPNGKGKKVLVKK